MLWLLWIDLNCFDHWTTEFSTIQVMLDMQSMCLDAIGTFGLWGENRTRLLPTAREGYVFRSACQSFCSRGERKADLLPPGSRPLGKNMVPDRKRHHTPLERTWDQTGSDIIHPPWYWHLVAATAAIDRHPTGMDSCLILCLNFSLVSKDFYLKN